VPVEVDEKEKGQDPQDGATGPIVQEVEPGRDMFRADPIKSASEAVESVLEMVASAVRGGGKVPEEEVKEEVKQVPEEVPAVVADEDGTVQAPSSSAQDQESSNSPPSSVAADSTGSSDETPGAPGGPRKERVEDVVDFLEAGNDDEEAVANDA
jgi:hypothetical protein